MICEWCERPVTSITVSPDVVAAPGRGTETWVHEHTDSAWCHPELDHERCYPELARRAKPRRHLRVVR